MIGHETKRVDLYPLVGFPHLKGLQVIGGVVLPSKDHLAVVPPLDDRVETLWQDQSCVSRHIKDTFV